MKRIVLDTGILLGIVRGLPWADKVHSDFSLDKGSTVVATSVVCFGELLSISERLGWEQKKKNELEQIMESITILTLNKRSVLNAYAKINAWTHSGNVQIIAPNGAPPPKPAISMKQNDMWIAATAYSFKGTLLSTDKDFAHLNNIWIDYCYIKQ